LAFLYLKIIEKWINNWNTAVEFGLAHFHGLFFGLFWKYGALQHAKNDIFGM